MNLSSDGVCIGLMLCWMRVCLPSWCCYVDGVVVMYCKTKLCTVFWSEQGTGASGLICI